MQQPVPQRRLSAILSADVVGYSRLMHADDQATLKALTERRALFGERVTAFGGRIVNAPGDSILAEFASVVDAVGCALELQRALAERNAAVPEARRMRFRMGINVGDVLVEQGGSIYGDGVNVAARLEGLCEPGGVALSGSAYEQVRDKPGLRFVDRGEHAVKNIARPVHVYALELQGAGAGKKGFFARRRKALAAAAAVAALIAVVAAAPELTRRLFPPADASAASIAVLPFANQSGDASREYFSDGVTEDIINALGRFSGIRVMAHNAVQAYKSRSATPDEIGRELGVRYLVRGSVRQADGRVRVGVELSDAMKGTQLWSERYEGEGQQMFEIQDRIVRNVVGALAVKVTSLEQQRAASKPPDSLEAYDLVLRARERLGRSDRGSNREARALATQALRVAPRYAEAYVALAEAELQRAAIGWIEDVEEAVRRSEDYAQRALAIDDAGANARAHAMLAALYSFTARFDQALQHADRAIELNPSDARVYLHRGDALLWSGRLDEAITAAERARRFDPRIGTQAHFVLGFAYYLSGRYPEALAATDAGLVRDSRFVFNHAVRAAALAQLGQMDEARRAAEQVRELSPFFQVDDFGERLVNPSHRAKVREGLRKAGL